ncbi:MAG: hypothetical protein ACREWG_14135 [Gammaproteobacteria bacterium]
MNRAHWPKPWRDSLRAAWHGAGLLVLGLQLTACAQAPEVAAMVPRVAPSEAPSALGIAIVRAVGGASTNPFMSPQVDNEGFRKALFQALTRSALFERVDFDNNGDYLLKPQILKQDVWPGLEMSATLKVRYQLRDSWSEKLLWEDTIESVYNAPLAEALYGLTRVRKAYEGAVRENLKTFLQHLAASPVMTR